MDLESVPILADAFRYYEDSELIELCDLFDIKLEFDDDKLAYVKMARRLVTQIEHGNNRRFLEVLVPSLLARCRERIAHTKWERQKYHMSMEPRILQLLDEMGEKKTPTEITVLEDHPFTAKSEAREFLGAAETEVTIVDNYVGSGTLDCLRDVQNPIRLLTGAHSNSIAPGFDQALQDFRSEGYSIVVRRHPKLHDRYILFNDRCWLVGSSLKDAGKKTFSMIECIDSKPAMVAEVERKWAEATVMCSEGENTAG
jgi:hypothetical protein